MLVAFDNPSPPDSPSPYSHGDPASAGQVGTGVRQYVIGRVCSNPHFHYGSIYTVTEYPASSITFFTA
jgi:hypothetical protein